MSKGASVGHYAGILGGYGAAFAVFWMLWLIGRRAWLAGPAPAFDRKWLEVGLAVLGVALVIAVGQLYSRDLMLPETNLGFKSLNQILIFAPLLLIVAWRGQFFAATFLPPSKALPGLAFGAALAALAVVVYAAVRGITGELPEFAAFLLTTPDHAALAVQVLLEDIAIAALLARLVAATGPRTAIIVVAVLFQAAHVPAFLADGVAVEELHTLVFDTGLGLLAFGALIVSRNIWWVWPVHTVMDLANFYPV